MLKFLIICDGCGKKAVRKLPVKKHKGPSFRVRRQLERTGWTFESEDLRSKCLCKACAASITPYPNGSKFGGT